MNRDFVEMLSALCAEGVEYLGPRMAATPDNAARVMRALQRYGAPLFDLTAEDFTRPDTVLQIGVAPGRVDILSGVSGVDFDEGWASRITATFAGLEVPVIGFDALLKNKHAAGRPKDLADIAWLQSKRG
jgi:hypothetical protein